MRYSRDQSEFDRAVSFIDATFALALTLLITSLDIDNPAAAFKSVKALADSVGAQFITFLIAFAVIAGYWLQHVRMVAGFVGVDSPTIVANLGLIATIVLLPFTTSAVGDPGAADLPLPTVLMAVNVAAASVMFTLVWAVAARASLLDHQPSAPERRGNLVGGLTPAAVFLASVPLAFLAGPGIARLFWLSLLVINPAVGRLIARQGWQRQPA
jgi:uncharacterized membrane protein